MSLFKLLTNAATYVTSMSGLAKRRNRREGHVIIALAEALPAQLIELAGEICSVYQKSEVVVLVPHQFELSEDLRSCFGLDLISGSILCKDSWFAVDAAGAFQIVIISEKKVESKHLSIIPRGQFGRTSEQRIVVMN